MIDYHRYTIVYNFIIASFLQHCQFVSLLLFILNLYLFNNIYKYNI
jgi:hypothetical protein